MTKMNRCPFCGEKEGLIVEHSDYYVFGMCSKCSCHGPELDRENFEEEGEEEEAAIAAWNDVGSRTREFSSITEDEKKTIEGWFPNFIIGKFVRLYFEDNKVMLDYTVGTGPFTLNVGDSPEHLFLLHDMGFNIFNRKG